MCQRRHYELYGVSDYHQVIDDLVALCRCESDRFPTALLATEALINAFVHGNGGDVAKPIRITACITFGQLLIRVEDAGQGIAGDGPATEAVVDPWSEGGRGLFLLRHYADQVAFDRNAVIIRKRLCADMEEGSDGD